MLLSLKKTSDTQVCSHFPPCLLRTSGSLSFTTCQKIPLSTVNLSLPSRLHVNPVKHFQGFIFFLNGRIWSIHSIFSKDIRFFLFLAIFSPHVHGISAAVWVASVGLVCSWMMGVLRVLSPIRCLHVLQRLLGLFGVHVVFACPRAEADIEMCTALRAPLLVTWEETKPETRERREETGGGLQLHV